MKDGEAAEQLDDASDPHLRAQRGRRKGRQKAEDLLHPVEREHRARDDAEQRVGEFRLGRKQASEHRSLR